MARIHASTACCLLVSVPDRPTQTICNLVVAFPTRVSPPTDPQGVISNVRMEIWAYMGGQARVLVQVCRSSVSLKSGLMVVLHEDETNLSALIAKSLPALSPLARAGFVVLI